MSEAKLKLGAATYAFLYTHSLESILHKLADWGVKYLELMAAPPYIWPRELGQTERRALRGLIKSCGLELVALNPTFLDINLATPNPGFRRESINQVKEIIHLAHDLETAILVLIPGRRHPLVPQPFDESWQLAKGAIIECLPEAERYGVVLGLENAPTRFLERSDQLRRMVEEIESDYVQIVYDTANGAGCESLVKALDTIKDYLVHIHLSDYSDKGWAHLPVGQGQIDFGKIAAKLKDIDFNGISIIETTYLESQDGGVLASKTQLEALGWRC